MAAAVGDNWDLSGRGHMQDPSAPDAVRSQPGGATAASLDEFDDVLNYDAGIGDVFRDTNDDGVRRAPNEAGDDNGLGIDEEIKVRKPRPKLAKLDETRLLGAKGLSQLRKISKTRHKFRGKGHEFSDVEDLLKMYQLWLDDMFPKAQLADCLGLIEKLGHTRRIQVMRREWIAEDKYQPQDGSPPYDASALPQDTDDVFMSGAIGGKANATARTSGGCPTSDDQPSEQAQRHSGGQSLGRTSQNDIESHDAMPTPNNTMEAPEDDELDQLLAEDNVGHGSGSPWQRPHGASNHDQDLFRDDMEAMAEMDDL